MAALAEAVEQVQQAELVGGQIAFVLLEALVRAGHAGEEENGVDVRVGAVPVGGVGDIERGAGGGLQVVGVHAVALRPEMGG